MSKVAKKGKLPKGEEYPDDCIVDFYLGVIEVFKKMDQQQKNIFDLLVYEFNRINDDLGSRFQMYIYMDDDLYNIIRSRGELNIFNLKINEETIFQRFKNFYTKPSNEVELMRHD